MPARQLAPKTLSECHSLRPLRPTDAPLLRDLRLRALADTPTAFYASLAAESAMTDADWQSRAAEWSAGPAFQTFLAFNADHHPVGIAAGVRDRTDPAVAVLISMWVDPAARRSGIGRRLVDEVLAWARQNNYRSLDFEVTESNTRARAFYESFGFRYTGQTSAHPHFPDLKMLGLSRSLRTRTLRPADWEIFRHLRLESLRDTPTAYGLTLAEAEAFTDPEWQSRTAARCDPAKFTTTLGLAPDGTPVGLASGWIEDAAPEVVKIVTMWVHPAHRRSGLAQAILHDLAQWASERGRPTLALAVTESNLPAIRLYTRLGFTPTGDAEPSRSHPDLRIIHMSAPLPLR